MKHITEKQINAIQKLARATKTEVSNVERMSSFEASKVITALIEKMNKAKSNGDVKDRKETANGQTHAETRNGSAEKHQNGSYIGFNGFNAARLGQAVNLAVYGNGIDFCLEHKEQFKERVVEIYRLLSEAEESVKASYEEVVEVVI